MLSNLLNLRFFLCCVLLIVVSAECNASALDSLRQLIKAAQYQKVLEMTNDILESGDGVPNLPEIKVFRADAYYYLNDLENSLDAYFAAIEALERSEINRSSLIQEVYSHIGFCYRELGLFDKALPHYLKSQQMARDNGDSVEVAIQAYNLGTVYFKLGKLQLATEMLDEAYAIDLIRKDTAALGFDLTLMSDLQVSMKNFDQALEYGKEALRWLRTEGVNANSKGIRFSKVGNIFYLKNNLDSADRYLGYAQEEYEALGDSVRLATLWVTQAKVEIAKKNYNQAVELAFRAKRWHVKSGYNSQVSYANLTMIKALLANGKLFEAEVVIKENLRVARELQLLDDLKETYFFLSELYEFQNSYKNSKEAFVKYQMIKDSLISMEEKQKIKQLELTFKFDKIESENEILRLNNAVAAAQIEKDKLQIMWLIISLAIALVGSVLIIWLMYNRYQLKRKLLMAEISELRVQIKSLLEGDTSDLGLDAASLNDKLNNPLSVREFEILQYAISDLNNSQIAEKIFVSVNTVKYHLKNIYTKLGVSNRKQALEYVIKSK